MERGRLMEGIVGLSWKERERLTELSQVKGGGQTLVAAAGRLSMSVRQLKRVWKRFRSEGAKGLVHRSRGRPSNRSADAKKRGQMLELCRGRLEGFGPTLAAEKLAEAGLKIDHETLRRWMVSEGLWKRRRKRGPHRKWRAPMEHFGELVQMDGSFHDWLERGDQPCLIDLVDDATSRMSGKFFDEETTEGAMRVLWGWILTYGIPRALYTDHKNLYVADREPTKDEQLAGTPALSAFGRACHKLGIRIIPAASPQAKGRIERRHGVLQDRLVKEMRLQGIKDLVGANELLEGGFIESINEKFSHSPANKVDHHRPLPKGLVLADVFVFEETRTVQNDWTISWDGRLFQITGPGRHLPRPRQKVVVRRRIDGTRLLLCRGVRLESHEILSRPARPQPPVKRPVYSSPQPVWIPSENHPWKRPITRSSAQATRQRLLRASLA